MKTLLMIKVKREKIEIAQSSVLFFINTVNSTANWTKVINRNEC